MALNLHAKFSITNRRTCWHISKSPNFYDFWPCRVSFCDVKGQIFERGKMSFSLCFNLFMVGPMFRLEMTRSVHKTASEVEGANKSNAFAKKIINSIWFNGPANGCSRHSNRFFIWNLLLTEIFLAIVEQFFVSLGTFWCLFWACLLCDQWEMNI